MRVFARCKIGNGYQPDYVNYFWDVSQIEAAGKN
jgi:hypothetical protein